MNVTMPARRAALLGSMALLALAFTASCSKPSAVEPQTTSAKKLKETTMKPILIALTSHDKKGSTGEPTGAYLPEIAHPHAVFVREGFTVELASVRGGVVPLDGVDRADPVNAAFLDNAELGRQLRETPAAASIDPSRYSAVLFAGGHGAMWDFPDSKAFARVAATIYESGGVVGAVCHGPAALVNLQLSNGSYLVAGKTVSAFTDEEERAVKLDKVVPFLLESRLVERGARFDGAPNWQPKVSVSERLVTGQNPASASGVAEAIVKLLKEAR